LNTKDVSTQCVLVMLADGFNEIETIVLLSVLRRMGICVKSVGVIGGTINSAHGILIKPDFSLTALERIIDIVTVPMIILPGSERNLSALEADPRVHQLIHQVIEQGGVLAVCPQGLDMARTAVAQVLGRENNDIVMVYRPPEQAAEEFAQDIGRRLEHSM